MATEQPNVWDQLVAALGCGRKFEVPDVGQQSSGQGAGGISTQRVSRGIPAAYSGTALLRGGSTPVREGGGRGEAPERRIAMGMAKRSTTTDPLPSDKLQAESFESCDSSDFAKSRAASVESPASRHAASPRSHVASPKSHMARSASGSPQVVSSRAQAKNRPPQLALNAADESPPRASSGDPIHRLDSGPLHKASPPQKASSPILKQSRSIRSVAPVRTHDGVPVSLGGQGVDVAVGSRVLPGKNFLVQSSKASSQLVRSQSLLEKSNDRRTKVEAALKSGGPR
mmetsp:Transcript_41757/g.81622  ORF Transcript_41757/g.81622 Transcript_41757/m.81622 type:complete len:285 (-) Transcript_41757:383-1237(-)|eukprot:CAMPEP_0173385428 /NCGR_PEP_ID=MMETSP1356-20130122/8037_1 /TAXON_ID=77927 ORGANISM="Hemiselmis virescens, Strain PCC157" /NCGR_SAMPLE_ID=MMETSP1356 /ASSEMBLY_ACC=CAM_ASM_000847 /LENGTH=284 /DNA_ID=CAMNT_0014341229 /DNA_START=41 /DNA_END=895 /DNA_ORIENTATION=-